MNVKRGVALTSLGRTKNFFRVFMLIKLNRVFYPILTWDHSGNPLSDFPDLPCCLFIMNTDIKVGIVFEDSELLKFESCDALVVFSREDALPEIPSVLVDKNYRINFRNFPLMNRARTRQLRNVAEVWLDELYRRPYTYTYLQSNSFVDYGLKPVSTLFEIIRRRKSYFNTAIALSIPFFFLKDGVPLISAFLPIAFKDLEKVFPMSLYKWILSPVAFAFAYNEYMLDSVTGFSLRSPRDIATSFLSFTLWDRAEVQFSYVDFFFEFSRREEREAVFHGFGSTSYLLSSKY